MTLYFDLNELSIRAWPYWITAHTKEASSAISALSVNAPKRNIRFVSQCIDGQSGDCVLAHWRTKRRWFVRQHGRALHLKYMYTIINTRQKHNQYLHPFISVALEPASMSSLPSSAWRNSPRNSVIVPVLSGQTSHVNGHEAGKSLGQLKYRI